MVIFKYLNIPQIPENIIPSVEELLALPYKEKTTVPSTFIWFRNKHCTPLVNEWIQDNIKIKVYTQYQFILSGIPVHRDAARFACINYIISTGGDRVSTNFYKDDRQTIVHSEVIPKKTWHTFLTYPFHDVKNILADAIRIAIGCTPVDEEKYIKDMFGTSLPTV